MTATPTAWVTHAREAALAVTIQPVPLRPAKRRSRKPQPEAPQTPERAAEDNIIAMALAILAKRVRGPAAHNLSCRLATANYLRLALAERDHEAFIVLYLDVQNGLIAAEEVARGSITTCQVYIRTIVAGAVRHNAASVILAHNHPSGCPQPSRADVSLTDTLRFALSMVDVKVLDHFIIGGMECESMASEGYQPFGQRPAEQPVSVPRVPTMDELIEAAPTVGELIASGRLKPPPAE
jgi:DNA repair protein RadC